MTPEEEEEIRRLNKLELVRAHQENLERERDGKKCNRCQEWKPRDTAFGKNRARGDGLTAYCKVCVKEYYAGRRSGKSQDETPKAP
jgi:hypothetical protein